MIVANTIVVVVVVVGIIYRQGYLSTELGLCVQFFTTRALSDASEGSKEPLRALCEPLPEARYIAKSEF